MASTLLEEAIQDEASGLPMLEEAIQDEAARLPMLNEAIQDEAAYAGEGWTTMGPNHEPEFS